MATSGVTTGLMTMKQAARRAYLLRNAIAPDTDVTGQMMDDAIEAANWLLKGWQSDGRDLWRLTDVTITWPADTATASLDVNYLDVVDLRLVDDIERPLWRWERTQGNEIINKTMTGTPSAYTPWRQLNKLWLRIWPVPDEETEFRADVVRVVEDITASSETIDIQQEWTEAFVYNLATRLHGGKLEITDEKRAKDLYDRLPQFELSGSVFLQPELSW